MKIEAEVVILYFWTFLQMYLPELNLSKHIATLISYIQSTVNALHDFKKGEGKT